MKFSIKCALSRAGAGVALLATAGFATDPAAASEMSGMVTPHVYNNFGYYNWNGVYLGLNGGGHFSIDTDNATIATNNFWTNSVTALMTAAVPFTMNLTGAAAGGQVGFNWHVSMFVFGAEGDLMGLSGTGVRNQTVIWPTPPQHATLSDSVTDHWMATVRARAGIAFDRALFFLTGGVAASNWSISHTYSDNFGAGTPPTTDQVNVSRYGWTAGGGLEYAFAPGWSARLEYLYANFSGIGSFLTFLNPNGKGATIQHQEQLAESVARLGISYKFGP
jgi:opacity protein-like surface antigen